jgi:hypothetical protein
MLKLIGRVSFGVLAGFLLTSGAKADIIPTMPSTATTPAGPGFVSFTYDAALTNDERLLPGNFFTIYDIPGLTSASGPAGWTATIQLLGVTPARVVPDDSASILNATFTYTGAPTGAGPADLGSFMVVTDSAHAGTTVGNFTAEAIKATGGTAGTPVDNIGSVLIPAAGVGSSTPLPPAAYAILPAIVFAGYYGRRLKRLTA